MAKPYYIDDHADISTDKNSHSDSEPIDYEGDEWTPLNEVADTLRRGRGWPKCSRNKTSLTIIQLNV